MIICLILSISVIDYDFTIKYGWLKGIYVLADKPQDFIRKCVSGGRTMCADNQKQLIKGRLQDFDAVSLYPSSMSIILCIPLGKSKVIRNLNRDVIMWYNDFYIEINIKSIQDNDVDQYISISVWI